MDQREIELHIYHKTSVKVFRPHQISPSCLGSMSFRQMHHAVMESGRNLIYRSTIYLDASSVECRNTIQEHPCVE